MKIEKKTDGQKIVYLTNREFETIRLLVCIGNSYVRTDRDVDRVTKITAEHIEQEILQHSDSKIEGG